MARVKQLKNPHRPHHRRTSWTRFHLPLGRDWPAWSNNHQDERRGPLVGVEGCEKVWMGRKVDDPEEAALIILWHTEDALKSFQATPACAEFLRGLPETADVLPSSSVTSAGASLQDLSLDSASVTSAPPPPPPPSSSSSSRFLIFQWHSPYRFEENLKGRITLTALELPCTTGTGTGTGDAAVPEEWRKAVHDAVDGFMPRGCEDIRSAWNARMQFWTAWAWADDDLTHLRRRAAMTKGAVEEGGEEQGKANTSARRAFMCQFRRWNGYSNATPERESAAAASELARESWARRVATVMPPVTDWEQERWDIQVVPRYEPPLPERCGDPEEEDPEYERKMREFFDEDSGEEEDK